MLTSWRKLQWTAHGHIDLMMTLRYYHCYNSVLSTEVRHAANRECANAINKEYRYLPLQMREIQLYECLE